MHSSRSIILSIGEGKREISFIGDKIRNNAMTVAQPPTQTWANHSAGATHANANYRAEKHHLRC